MRARQKGVMEREGELQRSMEMNQRWGQGGIWRGMGEIKEGTDAWSEEWERRIE